MSSVDAHARSPNQGLQGQGTVNGIGNEVGVPPSPSSPGKFAPPPPYSEYQVPAGALNASTPHASSSSTHPAYPYPQQHGAPYQHVHFAPNQQPGVPVIVVQPSTPAIPQSPGLFHQFGPTPLNDRQVLLPYAFYTERAIVDARARWRFLEAFFCAIGIYLGIALLVGVEGFGDGWWTFGMDGTWAAS